MSFIRHRNLERFFLLLIAAVLFFLFQQLQTTLGNENADVEKRIQDGTIVNLNGDKVDQRLKNLLEKGYYFEDPQDVSLAYNTVSKGISGSSSMDNIGELNKKRFFIPVDQAYADGGESYKKRASLARALAGFSGDDSVRYNQELSAPPALPSEVNAGQGKHRISGKVRDENGNIKTGCIVRLRMILPDSAYQIEVEDANLRTSNSSTIRQTFITDSTGAREIQSFTAYVRTDADGAFSFQGLLDTKSYELQPLAPRLVFQPQGTENLKADLKLNFKANLNQIRLFSSKEFNALKKDRALIVRTPAKAASDFNLIAILFISCFFLLHIFLSTKLRATDQFLLPVLMVLTGISLLTLLSLQDPLRDRSLAKNTISYFTGGFVLIAVLTLFDLRKFTSDSKLFRLFVFEKDERAKFGWPWAIAAAALLIGTILFGTGPEGSGVKVNLFGFQPSEIVKYLLLVFLAGFFAANERFISEYSRWSRRWSFFSLGLIAILGAIFLYLLLGDLGPAMVVCFSFIVLFSFTRGDFIFAALTAAAYVLAIFLIGNIWIATLVVLLVIGLLAFVAKKGLSESSVMIIAVMAGFLLLDQIPYLKELVGGPVERLTARKAIWQDPWNNEVYGGDHIANSIWAISTGGVKGQGLGEGYAKTIPEAHTDMIMPSMAEEFGLSGILCVFILYVILLHRSILIGRQTGRPFLFYLCAGIGISTFVQFLLIAGGSIGALPLSGVSMPFMSYGGSSLIINMVGIGFLLSVSTIRGSKVQMDHIIKQQDHNLVPALISGFAAVVLLGVTVTKYLFKNESWLVKPSLIVDRDGSRMFSYNPRISILISKLGAGNITDREGLVLATSSVDTIRRNRDSLIKAGLTDLRLQQMARRRLERFYPFEENTFFWTGDLNTGQFMGGTNGYFAEYEHLPELRGFAAPAVSYDVVASRYKEDRFLPARQQAMTVSKRDYTALAPLLIAGLNSEDVEQFKHRNRDVRLSIDAALQTSLQQAFLRSDTLRKSRISVVVMEDSTGDVICSAAYPLPTVNEPDKLNLSIAEESRLPFWLANRDLGFTYATQPGSTAKLLTASAALNKLGLAAAAKTIVVRQADLVRTKGEEPDEAGNINMERAIVRSNNPYFIKLANEEKLQEEMGRLYIQTGMFLRGVGGYFYQGNPREETQTAWMDYWRNTEFKSVERFDPRNIRLTRASGVSGMAWGQGELVATPASIARMAAVIANNGKLSPNRFVLKSGDSLTKPQDARVVLNDSAYADLLTQYMKLQSANKFNRLGIYVAGKTGTPERILKGKRVNDGWYVFFVPKASGSGHIVVCIRMENTKGSSSAVKLAGSHVIPELIKRGYIKGFDAR